MTTSTSTYGRPSRRATAAIVLVMLGGLWGVAPVAAQFDPCSIIACSDDCDDTVVNGGTGETCGWDSDSNSCMSGAVSHRCVSCDVFSCS